MGNSSDNSFYIGLRSYNQTTSSKFIGKDKEIDSLLSVLQKHHFVCLTGAEGSGKTSLIQAGLIPRLLSGFPGEVGSEWSVCSFRPSAFPLDNFKQALTFDGVLNLENKPNTTDILDYGDVFHSMKELSLASIYRNSEIYNKKNLLVVIDQVEDLFRFNKDFNHLESNDDDLLFDIAGKSVSIKGLPIYFLLSINSLFVSRLSQYPSLQELVSQSQYSIQNLSPTALKKVINKGGLKKSTSLDLSIDQIYNLINEDISYLPNLQFYLKLRAADNYKENLSIENCIGETFDKFHSELAEDDKLNLRRFLLALINIETNSTHSFKASVNYIAKSSNISLNTLENLLTMLSDRFDKLFEVVPKIKTATYASGKISLKGTDFIELNYSKYFNSEVFSNLIKEEEVSYRRFKDFTSSWKQYKMGESGLLKGPQLEIAEEWLTNEKHHQDWANKYELPFDEVVKFIQDSITENKRLIVLAEDKMKREAQKEAFQKKLYAGFAIVALILMLFAVIEWRKASASQRLVKKEAELLKDANKEVLRSSKKAKEALKLAKQGELKAKKATNEAIAEKQKLLEAQETDRINQLKIKAASQTIKKEKEIAEELLKERTIKNRLINIRNEAPLLMLSLTNAQKSGNPDQINKAIEKVVQKKLKFDSLNRLQPNIYVSDDWMNDLNQKAWSMIEKKDNYNETSMRLGVLNESSIVDIDIIDNRLIAFAEPQGKIYTINIESNEIKEYTSFSEFSEFNIKDIKFKNARNVLITTLSNQVYNYSISTGDVNLIYEAGESSNMSIQDVFYNSIRQEIIIVEDTHITFINEKDLTTKVKESYKILATSFNNSNLYIATQDQLLYYKDSESDVQRFNLSDDSLMDLNTISALHAKGNYLIIGFKSGQIKTYSIDHENRSLEFVFSQNEHFGDITSIYFDEIHKALYTSGIDNRLFRYDFRLQDNNFEEYFSKISTPKEPITIMEGYTNSMGKPMILTVHDQKYLLSWYVHNIDMVKAIKNRITKK